LRTLPYSPRSNSQFLHRVLATASGAAGGTFGLAALPVELPVSTTIMLRSIADIARSEGEDLSDPETALACVEVFALGGRPGSADASESGYFAVRGMLAKTVTEAARFVAERGVLKEGAPILLKFVTQVAARFGLVVTQKVAAQALPLVGALGGAAVNYAFIEHFQDVARGHFTVRRLERLCSAALSACREDVFFALRLVALRAALDGRVVASPRFVGSSACSLKGPFEPTGRLSMTPGFAMVAATTSGSSLSFAAPWWKRLLSAPHASRAAFMDGAAIARSKNPSEVS